MSKSQPARLTVLRTEEVAPSLRRVVFGGDGFEPYLERHLALNSAAKGGRLTDTYVKLVFLREGFTYDEPLDLSQVPPEAAPVLRTYTIRWIDPQARELAIDFVVHGTADEEGSGVAGPWASSAQPGDLLHLRGPGGAYAPDLTADWHLFVGDEAGLPAISAAIETLPAGARAVAFVEVDGPADELPWQTEADVETHWLHRGEEPRGSTTLLDDAVRAWDWWPGRAQAFVHGESALLKSVRPYVKGDRGVDRADLSVSAYWRRGATEEGFRQWKAGEDD